MRKSRLRTETFLVATVLVSLTDNPLRSNRRNVHTVAYPLYRENDLGDYNGEPHHRPERTCDTMNDQPAAPVKRENIWLNLGLNVLIPSLLLTKGQKWLEKAGEANSGVGDFLESLTARGIKTSAVVLVVALAFPIVYGIYDFVARKKYNFFSVLGFVSVLISGSVGLFELSKEWIAIKEAAIPALFAVAVIVSLRTPFPLVRTFLFSPEIFDVPKIELALEEKGNQKPFEELMTKCTVMLSGSFLFSAVLNFFVAKYFIRSETNTDEFAVELGKMNFWSWPIITVPSMVIMFYILTRLINGIHDYTGYELEDVMLAGQPGNSDSGPEAESSTPAQDASAAPPEPEQSKDSQSTPSS